uniref:Uncharacterized protein n=1 Tax=Rhizophora mucronata TaxID=61149 RepID=A0A2P2P2U9_RHIMU
MKGNRIGFSRMKVMINVLLRGI